MTRWAVIEMDPALSPQLYCLEHEGCGVVTGRKVSHSNPVRITTELRNISLDPGQEELFWWIPEPSVFRSKWLRESEGQKP